MLRRLASVLTLMAVLSTIAGCDEGGGETPKAKVKTREILSKRTQDIKDAPAEIKSGVAKAAPARPIAKDPITLSGNVYVSAIGQTSINNIKHAVDLYQAENGAYPKDYQEFMERIIKANNIALPTLPFYQEYAYDAPNHKLIILEYPDKKAAGSAR